MPTAELRLVTFPSRRKSGDDGDERRLLWPEGRWPHQHVLRAASGAQVGPSLPEAAYPTPQAQTRPYGAARALKTQVGHDSCWVAAPMPSCPLEDCLLYQEPTIRFRPTPCHRKVRCGLQRVASLFVGKQPGAESWMAALEFEECFRGYPGWVNDSA